METTVLGYPLLFGSFGPEVEPFISASSRVRVVVVHRDPLHASRPVSPSDGRRRCGRGGEDWRALVAVRAGLSIDRHLADDAGSRWEPWPAERTS